MLELIQNLFGTGTFIPHGHCYLWNSALVWLHVLSDLGTALAYYSIPLTLFYFVQQRQDLPFNWIYLMFSAFITACGTVHLLEVWTLWHPVYWLSGSIKAITAVVSLGTAVALFRLIPKALALPSPAQLELANQELKNQISDRHHTELELIRSRDLKEAIFDESTDAIFLVDSQTLLTLDCNRRAVDMFEAVSKNELLNIAGHTLQREQFSAAELEAITQEMKAKGFWSREIEYCTKLGRIFWGYINANVVQVAGKTLNLVRVSDISDRKQSEQQIQQSLREKEVLLKEIHHRVKNNLQIVYSLLRLQCRQLKDPQAVEALLESQNRIETIALIHEKLYRSKNLASIDFAEYIPGLVSNLFSTYDISERQIALETRVESISLDIDKAIPCGLIINELVSNALKYAFPAAAAGQIDVEMKYGDDAQITLIVGDNGVGLSADPGFPHPETLGLQLVEDFVAQLKGKLQVSCNAGTQFSITFPGGSYAP
ncbi:MAG: PAS domain S-box protein [Drouetiella hepatica Uher 2000/2452]|jgi:PAS domain S-box-containing protein|uniref:histidine kinase n=1 Tax=Drouetiella hepatica Uher 2000/2452 TaxID=904376 RepID=A0A951UM63_9CYAN|nr:PAS domain S-box protein [Drouetiella hepatica Uher 2000/2452]